MKKERFKQEQKLRETMRVQKATQYKQSRKLMKAVTFNKWCEYMVITRLEKREVVAAQKEASGNLAKAKLKPTKEMLKRRNSVLGVREGHSPTRGSKRGQQQSLFMPMLMMIEDR